MIRSLAHARKTWLTLALLLVALSTAETAAAAIDSHEATSASNADGAATSLTVAKPANVVEGSFLLAQVTFEKGNEITVSDVDISPPNDWILVARNNFSSDIGQAIFRKVAHGSEPSSYQWEFRKGISLEAVRASGGIIRYTGVDPAAPTVAGSGASGANNPLSAPSINAVSNSMLVAFFGVKKKTSLTIPAGMTGMYLQQHTNSSGPTIRAARELRTTDGPTLARTSTAGAVDKWVAQQFALRALAKVSQSITFAQPADRSYGAPDFDPGATASSGLPVSYAASPAAVCTIAGGQVHVVGVGTCSVTAAQGGNASYNPASDVTRSFAVQRAVVSIDAMDASKTYGEADPAPSYELSGFVGGEDAESAGVEGQALCSVDSEAGPDAGEYPDAIVCAPGTLAAANYSFVTGAKGALTVDRASQSISFDAVADRSYGAADFDPGATVSSGLPVSYAAAPAAVCTIVGGEVRVVGVGQCSVTASQGGNGNYFPAAADVTRTFAVDKAVVSIDANDASKAFGEADPAPSYELSGFVGGEDAESAGVEGEALCSVDSEAGPDAGEYPDAITCEPGTLAAPSYSFVPGSKGKLTIASASQSITFAAIADRSYGAADFDPGATASSGLPVSYAASPAAVCTIVSGEVRVADVGECSVTASQGGNVNYSPALDVTHRFMVEKAVVSIDANDASKTFGEANPTPSYELSGFVDGEDAESAGVEGEALCSVDSEAGPDAGEYPDAIVCEPGTLAAATYSFVTGAKGALTVDRAPQSISFDAIADRSYGAADFEVGATASSGLPVSYAASPAAVCTIASGEVQIVGVGECSVTASQDGNVNHEPATDVTRSFMVDKAVVSIDANDASKTFGEANPTPSYELSGFVDGEDAESAGVEGQALCSVDSEAGPGAGEYPDAITCEPGTLAAHNYSFVTGSKGKLTIAKASQSISFDAIADRSYGAADFDPGATASSGLSVSYAASPAAVCTIAGGEVRVVGVGECSVTASQDGNGNYLPAAGDVTRAFAVHRAVVSIDAKDASKAYGEANPAPGYELSGFVDGEDGESAGVEGQVQCSIDSEAGPGVGEYPDAITCAPGTLAAANYSFVTGSKGKLTIVKASQTISFAAIADKTVGGADFDPGATASSGLSVSYAASPASVCTIVGGNVHVVDIGACTVTASQGGNEHFDAAADAERSFTVGYRWDGYLQPINDTAHTGLHQSTFKLGSTIPVKFQIKDVAGAPLQQSTAPAFQRGGNRGACDTYLNTETVVTDTPTAGSEFRWDGSLDGYIYNFKSKGLTAGEYRIYANLADGSRRSVDICLK